MYVKVSQWMKITIIFERFIVGIWKHLNFQFPMIFLSSEYALSKQRAVEVDPGWAFILWFAFRGRSQTMFTKFVFFWPSPPSVYIFYGVKVYKKSVF